MNKWIVCVIISSLAGSLVYGLWWLLSKINGANRSLSLLYHTIRAVTVMFAILVIGGIYWSAYMQLYPTDSFWPIETTYIRLFLYLASIVWMAGAMCKLLGYSLERYLLWKRIKSLVLNDGPEYVALVKTCERMGIKRIPELLCGVEPATPELYGFFKPTIILPDVWLTEEQQVHVFAHELVHLKYHD